MDDSLQACRLAPDATAEPLVNRWAAWAGLVAPGSYSLHMARYQLPMLRSYLADPATHAQSLRDPALAGGPFVDVPAAGRARVKALLDATVAAQQDNMAFAQALLELQAMLPAQARGQSLDAFYRALPPALAGAVELCYDGCNQPFARVLEGALYRSTLYREDLQSLQLYAEPCDGERPFFMSTPRLERAGRIEWRIPFRAPELDALFATDLRPQPAGAVAEILGFPASQLSALAPLFTREPARPVPPPAGLRIRYLGHAGVLLETPEACVLVDPWLPAGGAGRAPARQSYADLPARIDYVLITHGHHDHFVIETLLRLRHRIGCLVVPRSLGVLASDVSLKQVAARIGFRNVVEIDDFEELDGPGLQIAGIPFFGEHADLAHGKSGYLVRAGGRQVLFAADSDCVDAAAYARVRSAFGVVDTVFLGMECVGAPLSWLYGAYMPIRLQRAHDQQRRTKGCDAAAALRLLEAVGARNVFVYAMGHEPWLRHGMGVQDVDGSEQARQAAQLLAQARARGLAQAAKPFGFAELRLVEDACNPG